MEGVLPLTLQSLNRERTVKGYLARNKLGGTNHLCQQGQELLGVFHRAAQAQHERILLGITAQTCSASLNKVCQVNVVVLSTAAAEQRCQQVMGTPCSCRVVGAAERKQQFRGQNPRA